MTLRIEAVTIDATEPSALAGFWAEALGWRVRADADGDIWVEPPAVGSGRGGPGPTPLLFLAVPHRKSVKNRVHLDLRPADQVGEVERLLGMGAARASIGQEGTESWVVLCDPEGNEFCVLSPEGE